METSQLLRYFLKQGLRILVVLVLFPFKGVSDTSSSLKARSLLDQGWQELIRDNDTKALELFQEAHRVAQSTTNLELVAEALLDIGICNYSVSYTEGIHYAMLAMSEYTKVENSLPAIALQGRSKCLQLISTIYSRQGKYKDAIRTSREALQGFPESNDSTGYRGLIYHALGNAYGKLNLPDSAAFYHYKALEVRLQSKNFTYLPGSLIEVAQLEINRKNKAGSRKLLERALFISDSTENKQARVSSILGICEWESHFNNNKKIIDSLLITALLTANSLRDHSFRLNVLNAFSEHKKKSGDFQAALSYQEEIKSIKDSLNDWEKQRIQQMLEVQFNLGEKDRSIQLKEKENKVQRLTNFLLTGVIFCTLLIGGILIYFQRRSTNRNKLLLKTKVALVNSLEDQKKLRELQVEQELEFKEGQLTALTVHMRQKSDVISELRAFCDADPTLASNNGLLKILQREQNLEKDWTDFNTYFESVNKSFFTRIKKAYPEISPNDLRLCALIKLNLSIKEMAGLLNISPDSVKTARYRLRKKLQLATEENLTEFILKL